MIGLANQRGMVKLPIRTEGLIGLLHHVPAKTSEAKL